jgi:hypothetical protein
MTDKEAKEDQRKRYQPKGEEIKGLTVQALGSFMQLSKSVPLYVGCSLALLVDNRGQGISAAQVLLHLGDPILHPLDPITFGKNTRGVINKRGHWENLQATALKRMIWSS